MQVLDKNELQVLELGAIRTSPIQKSNILAFSSAGPNNTVIIYNGTGDIKNPDSFIIQEDVTEFAHRVNGTLSRRILKESMKQIPKPKRFGLLTILSRAMQIGELTSQFERRASAHFREHADQDRFWFLPDKQGNYKNIAADDIYEVEPNPNSPWAQHP